MKTQKFKILLTLMLAGMVAISSCVQDLDTEPIDDDVITSASVYKVPENYKAVLAKLYAGLAVSGQTGPHGDNDLSGLDEGFGQYLRAYWYAQELPTDEAIIAWNDGNLRDYQEVDWDDGNEFITNMYYRIYYQISLCNEFIRETTDAKISERGITVPGIEEFRAEARFLRALSYWHALDMFGAVPFVTEDDPVGSFFPEQISKADLFAYIESELLAIENDLAAPRTNEYARADQAAAWMLLAKLYLNAETYIGTEKYTECLTYVNNVIAAGYSLHTAYDELFLADNDRTEVQNEVIFPITFDGENTKTWGGTTFLVAAQIGGTMDPKMFGTGEAWGGLRTMKKFVSLFMDVSNLKSGRSSLKSTADYPVLYVPGDQNGWDVADATSVLGSVNSDNNYEGYIYFGAGNGFKLTDSPDWDHGIFGDTAPADGVLDSPGDNITVADEGYYKINVDTTTKIYTMLKTDWGVIGSATADEWNSDQNMTYDADNGYWSAVLDLTAGEIKFRANDDWAVNYGDDGADGVLDFDAASNITVTSAGTYEIKLMLGSPDYTYSIEPYASDGRKMFYTDGQTIDVEDMFEFTNGYAITKWKNVTSVCDTCLPTSYNAVHNNTDFPLFRLADAYLMYAECVLRGGSGGDAGTALDYINDLRERAYGGSTVGDIDAADLDLDFILDERGRELFWEAQRRTDLVRFDKLTSSDYIWQWKGGVPAGRGVDDKYNIFPIPGSDIGANPNLTQNTGY